MCRPGFLTALLLAAPALAADPPPEPPGPPDAEFLEFLGEMAGADEDFVRFMETVEARRALERAGKEAPKEGDDE